MVPFLKAMLAFPESPHHLPAVGIHVYGDIGELRWAIATAHDEFHCPIFVTEFGQWNAPNDDAEQEYLTQAVDLLERTPYVQGYAWFKERLPDHRLLSLFADHPGELTALGKAYVAMPTHDPAIFYHVPGRLAADRYIAADKFEVAINSGAIVLKSTDDNAFADYQIQVDQPGRYEMTLRGRFVAGTIELFQNAKLIAHFKTISKPTPQELKLVLPLNAGPSTLRLHLTGHAQFLESLEITTP